MEGRPLPSTFSVGRTHQAQASLFHTPAGSALNVGAGTSLGVTPVRSALDEDGSTGPGRVTRAPHWPRPGVSSCPGLRVAPADSALRPCSRACQWGEPNMHAGPRLPAQAQSRFPSAMARSSAFTAPRRRPPSLPAALLSNCTVWQTFGRWSPARPALESPFQITERQGYLVRDVGAVWKALWAGEGRHRWAKLAYLGTEIVSGLQA